MNKNESAILKQLTSKRDLLVNKLLSYKYLLRGTIVEKGNICGNPNCKCKRKRNPELHGPYKYLSHRSRKKINMIFLTDKKKKYAVKGIGEYQELMQCIYEISEINFKILRYHYARLPDEI